MQNILFEARDSNAFAEAARFFERHLISLSRANPLSFDSDPSSYEGADGLIISVGDNVPEASSYLTHVSECLNYPVIVIADYALTEVEETLLLESGAADCLAPPYSLRELLARLRARTRRFAIAQARTPRPNYRFGNFGLNCETRELVTTTKETKLAKKEFSLLAHFIHNNFAGITREELLEVVSAEDLDVNDRSIDSLVSRLRDRFVEMGGDYNLIRTIRGFGYTLECEVAAVTGKSDLRAFL
ncbi:response regulator transcription factor [Rhizobium leguminosarum]|uniref:winged helix-turn-helix domain-containing protein n=1 Tax=Rhizobium leguminosarum TaxID=384 RepID=UPI001C962625|nr:winged helix-turn-helix domain-containing protein [Rhizobium leguminosarum]MBY5533710.1 response regulator transcription factor [Rhizobium leguminosarum]